jgi:flagellar motility protein MotE (MotC chaperone)
MRKMTMRIRLSRPRLLPVTIMAMAALLAVKSAVLVRAAVPPSMGATAPAATAKPAETTAVGRAGAPDQPASACEVPVSESEKALLQDLRARRGELDARAAAMDGREAIIAAAEKRLRTRVDELNSLQARLEALEADRARHDDANWRGLVKMYEGMRPRDAAVIFNDLDLPVLLPVLDRMKESKAAPVLAAMQPERAREVTQALARMRTRANTVEPPPKPAGG